MFQKWFNQAARIDALDRELDFARRQKDEIEKLLVRSETRERLLETSLTAEQKAHNLALRRYADQVSKQVGLPQHFVADAKPKPEEMPDPDVEARIMLYAQKQMEADIDQSGEAPWTLEQYAAEIRKQGVDNIILN